MKVTFANSALKDLFRIWLASSLFPNEYIVVFVCFRADRAMFQ